MSTARGVVAGRAAVRFAVPERLVRMAEFGLQLGGGVAGERWWSRVADHMQRLVSAHLPTGARRVEMVFDPERTEVEVRFEPAASR